MADKISPAERSARLYLEKVNRLAHVAADRMGPSYGDQNVNWLRIVEAWSTPHPTYTHPDGTVDEQPAWDKVMGDAIQALKDDPSLDRDEVMAEIPVRVADLVYPQRRKIVLAMGGTNDLEHAENAEKISERALKARGETGKVPPTPPEPTPPEITPPEAPVAVPAMPPQAMPAASAALPQTPPALGAAPPPPLMPPGGV